MANQKMAPADMTRQQKTERAIEYRRDGLTYLEIGERLGMTKGAVYKMIQRGFQAAAERISDQAEALREMELRRLDKYLREMTKYLDDDLEENLKETLEHALAAMEGEGETDDELLDRLVDQLAKRMEHRDQKRFAAVDRLLKISERRAKLLGLDAPQKIAPTDPTGQNRYDGITNAERNRRIVEILAEAQEARASRVIDGEHKVIKS